MLVIMLSDGDRIPDPPDTPEQVKKKKLDKEVVDELKSSKVKKARATLKKEFGMG